MPRYRSVDIPHAASTDHRILRDGKTAPPPGARRDHSEVFPLQSFYRDRANMDNREDERDRALAVVQRALEGNGPAMQAVAHILSPLEEALRRDPKDVPAAQARAYALALLHRWAEALPAFEALLAAAPERELALVGAASVAEKLKQTEVAEGYWRRAIAANPLVLDYRRSPVQLLMKREAWPEALPQCQAWLKLDPFSAEARAALVACLLEAGQKAEARAEFARLEALAPANLPELRIRFRKRLQ
jgi:tetratricopeptide (TPR) repeat protein